MIYLDNNTRGAPLPLKEKAYWHALEAPYAESPYDDHLAAIHKLLPDAIPTSDGAEAIAAVLFGHFHTHIRQTGKNQILYARHSEAPVLYALQELETLGCTITPFNPAEPLPITPRTSLITLPHADGLTGHINPIPNTDIPLHIDITNTLGKAPLPTATYLTLDGGSLHAPTPCGALIGDVPPLIPGRPQVYDRVLSLRTATDHILATQDTSLLELARLRDHFETRLKKLAPVTIHTGHRTPATTAISFPDHKNEYLLYHFTRQGLFATIGGGRFQNIANILSDSAISFTLAHDTTEEGLDRAANLIAQTLQKLTPLAL